MVWLWDLGETDAELRVQDNLSTHKPASLYEAFPAAEARRLVERFEWHYTPKHGSWLDMAESELSVLARQCLDRRIPNKQALIEEVTAWEEDRNKNHAKADWQFTTGDARVKLKRLYPAIWTTQSTSRQWLLRRHGAAARGRGRQVRADTEGHHPRYR